MTRPRPARFAERGGIGSIGNRKTVEKFIQSHKTAKIKIKTENRSSIIKTLTDPPVVTSGAHRGLATIRDRWRPLKSKRNRNPNRKTGNHITYQIWKPISILGENWKPNAKNRKSINCNEHKNRKTKVFLEQFGRILFRRWPFLSHTLMDALGSNLKKDLWIPFTPVPNTAVKPIRYKNCLQITRSNRSN